MKNNRDGETLKYIERYLKLYTDSELNSLSEEESRELIQKIKSILDDFNPNLPDLVIEGISIKLLTRLKNVGKEEANFVLEHFFTRIQSKKPSLMDIDKFWTIIESSYRTSRGNSAKQFNILVDKLVMMNFEEIYCFDEYFQDLSSSIRDVDGGRYNLDLYSQLSKSFNITSSDSGWSYYVGHIVMLGKEAYELARTDPLGYKTAVRKRKYPYDLGEEFWAIFSQAFDKKIGVDKFKYGDHLVSKELSKEVKNYLTDINEEYDKIAKKRRDELEKELDDFWA